MITQHFMTIPFQSRIRTADEVKARLGPEAVMVPSSNHADIMAGQGTIATELLEQVTRSVAYGPCCAKK